jgi:hypothetical protein
MVYHRVMLPGAVGHARAGATRQRHFPSRRRGCPSESQKLSELSYTDSACLLP